MRTIVAADVHGVTTALRNMIAAIDPDALFLSPWDTDACPFASEQEAAAAFTAGKGIASYAARIAEAAQDEPAFIIGFSVGASAAWVHAASPRCHPASVATLFYGSRIRDHADLVPAVATTVVLAEKEPSFDPVELVKAIHRERVRAFIEPGTSHGFMNPDSPHHAPAQSAAYLRQLAADLARYRQQVAVVPVPPNPSRQPCSSRKTTARP